MTATTALGEKTPRIDQHASVVLTEVTDLALASVTARRGHEGACRDISAGILGADLPDIEGLVHQNPLTAFWMGPDQWMVSAPHDTHEVLAARLKSELTKTASVTEQTDAWVVFDLAGDVAPVMELLCPVNMRTFRTGKASRTTIDHMGCFVTRPEADDLRILGPRSSAGSLHHALLTAMLAAH